MMGRLKRRFLTAGASVAAVMLMFFGTAVIAAPSASAASGTISGDVQCFYGNNQVVGIWVDAASGTDGWATRWDDGYGGNGYSYTLSQPSSYTLHVGCGGTSSSWGSTMYTPLVGGNYYDWVCSYSISLGFFCAMS